MGHRDPLVAKLRALGSRRLDDLEYAGFSSGGYLHHLALPREPPVVVIGRAGALAGDHARPDRPLRGARGPEHLALERLDHALEDLAALAGLRVGDADAGDGEAALGVVVRVRVGELQAGV